MGLVYNPLLGLGLDQTGAPGAGTAIPLLQPTTLLSSPLSSYVAPTIGQATLGFTRMFEVSRQTSTPGIWAETGNQTATYTYDFALGTSRYKSTQEISSAIVYGHSRDLTQAAWVKTSATSALSQTGITGVASSASLLTATANDATAIYDLGTIGSATRNFSVFLRRVTGSGRIWITRNGGTNWLDVTSQVNSGAWTRVQLSTTIANPDVGIRLETNGDAIGVDAAADIAGSETVDPFITRSDQRSSTLTLSAIKPAMATGRRFAVSVRARIKTAGSQLHIDVGVPSVNCVRVIREGWNGLCNLASFSSSVIRYNVGGLGIPLLSGQDYTIDLLWGGRRIDLIQNGVLTASLDLNHPDPATMSEVALTGDAEISNLTVRELRSHNIVLVGDSITNAPEYPALYRRQLNPYDYTIAGRGVSGNIITDVTARVATDVTTAHIPRASSNIVVLWIGTNSLAANVSAATALTQLATLISTIKAGATWTKVICVTTLKRGGGFSGGATSGTFETQRLVYNAGLVTAGADAVVSLDSVTEASDPTNQDWFDSLFIHPRAELYELFWPIIRVELP